MNFKTWILGFVDDISAIGDVASQINADPNFPETENYNMLIDYFDSMHASDNFLDAFESAWNLYESSK